MNPTAALVSGLQDKNRWVVIKDVPIFDEHEEFDADGTFLRRFGRIELQEIVDKIQWKERECHSYTLFGPGHTITEPVPEDQQPIPFGVATNMKVGNFGNNKLGILADCYVAKEKYDDFLTYPHRSIELWFRRKDIPWIACLRRAPDRNLGLITDLCPPDPDKYLRRFSGNKDAGIFERKADECLYYQLGQIMTENSHFDEEKMYGRFLDKFWADDRMMKFMDHCKFKYEAPAGAGSVGGPIATQQDPAVASGTNTFIPGGDTKEKKGYSMSEPVATPAPAVAPDPAADAARMKAEQDAIRYSAMEKELADLRTKYEASEGRYQRSERERSLVQLQGEGFVFDRAQTLDKVCKYSAEQFDEWLKEVRAHWNKSPVGQPMIAQYAGNVEPSPELQEKPTDPHVAKQAMLNATRSGKSYDECLAELKKK